MPPDQKSVPFRVPVPLFERIEAARGLVARERFLRALVEEALDARDADRGGVDNGLRRAG